MTQQPQQHLSFTCLRTFPDGDAAYEAAQKAARDHSGIPRSCTLFHQGGRLSMVGSFPMRELVSLTKADPTPRGEDPSAKTNRPEDKTHWRGIQTYISENPDSYILPPLNLVFTQATQNQVLVFTTHDDTATRPGWFVIPEGSYAIISDGMHRRKGIAEALSESGNLLGDSVAVQITVEPDIKRIHQDFADMGRTKAISASLLTAYDRRDPVNRLVAELGEECALLKGHIDKTAGRMSKHSPHLLLGQWLRNMLGGYYTGDYTKSRKDRCWSRLGEDLREAKAYVRVKGDLAFLFDCLTSLPFLDPTQAGFSPRKAREKLVFLNAGGWGTCSMFLYAARKEAGEDDARFQRLVQKMVSGTTWTRQPADPVWEGGLVENGHVAATRAPIFRSMHRLLVAQGLPSEERYSRYA